MSPIRQRIDVLDPGIPIEDAIRFVVRRSPGCTNPGIMARLRSYGWTPNDVRISGSRLSSKLLEMEKSGLVKAEKWGHNKTARKHYWPAEVPK